MPPFPCGFDACLPEHRLSDPRLAVEYEQSGSVVDGVEESSHLGQLTRAPDDSRSLLSIGAILDHSSEARTLGNAAQPGGCLFAPEQT